MDLSHFPRLLVNEEYFVGFFARKLQNKKYSILKEMILYIFTIRTVLLYSNVCSEQYFKVSEPYAKHDVSEFQ